MTAKPIPLLVTGGAGFIGSCYVAQAILRGHHVVVLDKLTYAGHRANLEWIPTTSSGGAYELVVGDIANTELVEKLLKNYKFGAVLNFAAESHVDNSIAGPQPFIDTNVTGTYHLLQSCLNYWKELPDAAKKTFRYVQISTDEVYGSLGPQGAFTENSQIQPNSPYSASKAAGDHLARSWFHTYGMPTIITRCSNNYGPRQYPEKLIPHMIHCALSGKPLPVYGDGKNVRDWIHVEDHCEGVYLAMEKGEPGEVYNFGGHSEMNNITMVQLICEILDETQPRDDGKKYAEQISFVKDRPGHDRRYAIDDSKAETKLGFSREHDFKQGLKNTIKWYLAHQEWCRTVLKKQKDAA